MVPKLRKKEKRGYVESILISGGKILVDEGRQQRSTKRRKIW